MGINRNENHQSIHDQKNIFLPMFCRLSTKDVKLNTIPISAAEPSSPKVSCMGQVKRNNRVTGFPAAATTTITAANHHKYTKSKSVHLFAKTLLSNPTTMNAAAAAKFAGGGGRSGSRSCRTNREVGGLNNVRRSSVKTSCDVEEVDISEMDPPLPVVKRAAIGRDEVNIWKRRSNGAKALQIEPINLPNNKFLTTLSVLS